MIKLVMLLPISSHEPVSVTWKKNCRGEGEREKGSSQYLKKRERKRAGKEKNAHPNRQHLTQHAPRHEQTQRRQPEVTSVEDACDARDARESDKGEEELEEEEGGHGEGGEDGEEAVHWFEVELRTGRKGIRGRERDREGQGGRANEERTHRADTRDISDSEEPKMQKPKEEQADPDVLGPNLPFLLFLFLSLPAVPPLRRPLPLLLKPRQSPLDLPPPAHRRTEDSIEQRLVR